MSELHGGEPISPRLYEETDVASIKTARLSVSVFCALMAIAIAMVWAIVQRNVWEGFIQVSSPVTVSICLLLFPQGYREIGLWLQRSALPWKLPDLKVGMDAIITLLGLIAFVGLSWLKSYFSIDLMPALWGLAVVLLGLSLWRFIPQKMGWQSLTTGLIAAIFYLYLSWSAWGVNNSNAVYMTPYFRENLLGSTLHIDTLFHSSIASMIQTYGLPSTGLDGPVYAPYHTGSHWLFAQLSPLLNLKLIEFYNLAYPVIFLPLFFHAFLNFSIDLRSLGRWTASPQDLRKDWRFWGLLYLGFAGVLPISLYKSMRIAFTSSLFSQSHLVSLTLAFLTLSLCLCYLNYRHQKLRTSAEKFLVLMIIVLSGMVTFCKVSVGFILFCIFLYAAIRLRFYRNWLGCIGVVSLVGVQLALFKLMGHTQGSLTNSSPIQLFAYFRYVEPEVRVFWIPVLLFWCLLYLSLRFRSLGLETVSDLVRAGWGGLLMDVEILVLISFIGLAPSLLLNNRVMGSGAYYFMDFQMWLSLSFILGCAHRSMVWQYLGSLKPHPVR